MSNPSSPPLITSLLSPTTYPHQVNEVELRETHISWVLMTGDFAYKIKKPVKLGFLDFSTLDQRCYFCHEELRLNRRYSTDLYLDVVPIVETQDGPQIDGSGTPIEFAVRMQQFDERELATRLLKNGELSPSMCDELAATVAWMHHSGARDGEWGSLLHIKSPVDENFTELHRLIKEPSRVCQLDELESWSHESFEELAPIFEMRRTQGFVRECHGDLHLGNIVRWRETLTPFDCIEFNEAFRWIDVMNEVAFLVMDLDDHTRSDLGTRFLNAYLELTGDYEGLSVLPFYLAYRAIVRAKVHAIRAHQQGLPASEFERLRHVSYCYLDLAQQYTRPLPASLTITHGVSGSGKTTGTQEILNQQRLIRIRSDVERKRISGMRPQDDATASVQGGIYSPTFNEYTYDQLFSLTRAVLKSGFPVVVDATFLQLSERERFRRLADDQKVPFRILHFEADVQALRDRIQNRQHAASDASDATIAVLEHQLQIEEPLTANEQQYIISSTRPGTEPELRPGN